MKILAIIPCYKVADYLPSVIKKVSQYQKDILVVDDGSGDGTSDIALAAGANLICHPRNRGKGATLRSGFAYAIDSDYDAVITLDGDGQHDPKYIPEFIRKFNLTGADLIIGSRSRNKSDMPLDRRLSNWLTSNLLSLLLRKRIDDSQCGFRLITTRLLKSIELRSARFELETEIIIKSIKQGYRINYIPITVLYGRDFPTAIRRIVDTSRWLKMVLEEI